MHNTIISDRLICYKGRYYTGADIEAMREWISDCQWADMDEDEISELDDITILRGVNAHVEGGLREFINRMC